MKQYYWNTVERGKIDAIRYSNPEEAIRRYESYMIKYPRDYEAKILYASVFITLKEFDYAYKIIEETKNEYRSNRKVMENEEIRDYLEEMTIREEMRCFAYTNQFYNLYDLFFELTKEQQKKYDNVKFYCCSKLGYIKDKDASNLRSYAKQQMYSYDNDRFNSFINIHRYESEENNNRRDKIFDKDFPLDKVIEEVKKNLDYDKCTCTGYYTDQYIFKYDLCGKDNGVFQDYFKVLCLHGTNDILTLFPAIDCEKLDYVDLNYLNENQVNDRPSQIEKFNKRYTK